MTPPLKLVKDSSHTPPSEEEKTPAPPYCEDCEIGYPRYALKCPWLGLIAVHDAWGRGHGPTLCIDQTMREPLLCMSPEQIEEILRLFPSLKNRIDDLLHD